MKKVVSGLFALCGGFTFLGIGAEESQALPSFRWSEGGAIPGMVCVPIREGADINDWKDNFLCSKENLGLRWSQSKAISGMRCTRVFEDADIPAWGDNFLCAPPNAPFTLSWSEGGAISGKDCTRVFEDADIPAWRDNFLCVGAGFPITGNRDDAVSSGRMNTSFTLNSNGSLTAVTNTRTKVKLKGFTGAVSIVLLDHNKQPIWASDTHSYGVDGCAIKRCNRNDNWSANVPDEILQRVEGYSIIQQHNPTWLSRIGDGGDKFLRWLGSDEGKAAVGAVVATAVML